MLLFATPNNYYHYRSAQQYPSQQSIHQLRSINGLLNHMLDRDDYHYTREPYYGYTTNDLAEFEYELALSRATRKAAIQQLHRDRNAGIRGWYAVCQAQRNQQEKEHQLLLQRKQQEMERKLRAAEANSCAESYLGAYWPFGLPVDSEHPTQATASTSKAPVQNEHFQSIIDHLIQPTSTKVPFERVNVNQDGKGKAKEIPHSDAEPCFKDRLEDRLMDEYQSELSNAFQSILARLSEGPSTDTPSERVPVTFAAPTSTQVNVDEERNTSSHKGKGKAKETPDSDAEEEPSASPDQVASSLSQITSIVSRLETLIADFQFPAELDFSPSRSPSPAYSALDTNDVFALTYTATNAPLRAQEHALSLLLGDLDDCPKLWVTRSERRKARSCSTPALGAGESCLCGSRARPGPRYRRSSYQRFRDVDSSGRFGPARRRRGHSPIEAIDLPIHADLTQPSSSSQTHPTPPPLDTPDSHSQNTLGASLPVSIPDSETLTHADADIPAEVADTTDEPVSFAPAAAASSFLGSDHEQTPSEESDSESYSSSGISRIFIYRQ
ncbi:hypothetical protein EV702DRAFT_1055128 [Suillus placidus]|uniref:Uncharacterized protein n=1 Tax=Suillus placidus TaxID=48579 RepID=A0A9P7A741_9AGAM|nr:hypothetical protein EV702DRAFT_1055128 [Suillus placidus]